MHIADIMDLKKHANLSLYQAPPTMELTKRLVREYLRPYWKHLLLGLICMVVASATTALLAKQMKPIIDDVFIAQKMDKLWKVAIEVMLIFVFRGFSSYGQNVYMTYVGERIVADMRTQLISHVLRADLAFYHANSTGDLLSRLTNDVNMLHRVVSRTVTSIVRDGLTLIFLVIVMFYEDWTLSAIAFFAFPLAIFPIIKIGRKMRKTSGNVQIEMSSFTIMLQQMLQGSRLIKSYNLQAREESQAKNTIEALFKKVMKMTRVKSMNHPIMECLGGMAIVTVILYGGYQVISGAQTSGAFFTFITALLLAYEPLKHIANFNAELQEKLAAATRVFAVLDVKPEITDQKDAKDLAVEQGFIQFKDVHFSYESDREALSGVSLEIPAGKTVALVGPSGSGKSTIMNLIPRFYECDSGHVLIDGEDTSNFKIASLRDNIALVSQEVTLFDDTVAANIGFGKLGSSMDEIIEAAKSAAAHEFIVELPDGYNTIVGEQGVKLSGGQRQRLAIARAMLKDSPILLLDEATSALDSESEKKVQQALSILKKGRTTLIIAHRLSTIIDSDIIYVISDGKAISAGDHKYLLSNCQVYSDLCKAQFGSTTNI